MIWSMACMAKFIVMNSTMGRKPPKPAPDADTGKTHFGDRRIDHALVAEFFKQSLADLISALILRDFLAHSKTRWGRGAFLRPSRRAKLRARSGDEFFVRLFQLDRWPTWVAVQMPRQTKAGRTSVFGASLSLASVQQRRARHPKLQPFRLLREEGR